jgi:hypothetical protein
MKNLVSAAAPVILLYRRTHPKHMTGPVSIGKEGILELSFPCGYNHLDEKPKEKPISTAACGIDCNVCRLHVNGVCSACGSGTSIAGREKLAAQHRILGTGCPVLACAVDRGIPHCMRDCEEFPCNNFAAGPYPFSRGFLDMQARRRTQATNHPTAAWPDKSTPHFWKKLAEKSKGQVCDHSGATLTPEGTYSLLCLNESWIIDVEKQSVIKSEGVFGGEWDRQVPFLILVYLASATAAPLSGEMTAPREMFDLRQGLGGRYALETAEIEEVFGNNPDGFLKAAAGLGGEKLSLADASASFLVFPKFRVDYLLWLADREFPARLTILFDSGIRKNYPQDVSSVVVNLFSRRLLLASKE